MIEKIKFRSNGNEWHAYEVCKKISVDIGNDILKQFLHDGLITRAQYRKLIKK